MQFRVGIVRGEQEHEEWIVEADNIQIAFIKAQSQDGEYKGSHTSGDDSWSVEFCYQLKDNEEGVDNAAE